MNAYIYQADIYCEDCGEEIRAARDASGDPVPMFPDDESSYDSDDYPKGPYPDGGGEADSPQHCRECGLFLENPLTKDGMEYVADTVRQEIGELIARSEAPWIEWYRYYCLTIDVTA